MDSPPNLLPEALRLLVTESGRSAIGEHPSPDDLIAYTERELPGPERQQIQRHLAICPECAQTVLDLESFPDIELRDEALRRSDEEEAADWRSLRRLLTAPNSPAVPAPTERPRVGRRRVSARLFELAAAALLAVAVGLGLWAARLHRQVETLSRELSAPRANLFVSDLMPQSRRRGTAVLQVPAQASELVLILNVEDLRSFPDYEVALLDGRNVLLWRKRGLRRGPEGNFGLSLPRASIPAGPCQIRLFGLAGSQRTPLATYPLRLELESPG